MKVTVVPAQVTTVEDRITGSLSVSQMALFAVPVFGGSLLYAVLPPSMEVSDYKLTLIAIMTLLAGVSAIRIKGRIILVWMAVLLSYLLRPRIYVFTKNTSTYREQYYEPFIETARPAPIEGHEAAKPATLSAEETVHIYAALDNPISRLRFETTKEGKLNVRITEVQ